MINLLLFLNCCKLVYKNQKKFFKKKNYNFLNLNKKYSKENNSSKTHSS